MSVIRAAEHRRTATPNAVMTTLASPTLGGAEHALWRVEMAPGQAGPKHAFDVEQVWLAIEGAAMIELGDERVAISRGDTIVMAPLVSRRVVADAAAGFSALVSAPAGARALLSDGTDKGVPDWIV